VADLAPAQNQVELKLSFSTAPLVTNGSFEEVDKDNKPIGWSLGPWSSDAATKYEMGTRPGGVQGQRALCIVGLAGSLNLVAAQDIGVLKPGVTYVFSGYYKGEGGANISAISYKQGQSKEVDYIGQSFPPTKDWAPFSWEFQLHEHDRAQIAVRSGFKGETWYDDVKVEEK
jgi:hypothetical protein